MRYSHRQFGTLMVYVFGAATLMFLLLSVTTSLGTVGLIAVALTVIVGTLFSAMTIEISDGFLRWKFGPGLIRKQVSLADIAGAEVTRTRVWEGWGIRWTLRGWLYNVSGFDAVLIRLTTGKQFLLGSDQPHELARVLNESRATS